MATSVVPTEVILRKFDSGLTQGQIAAETGLSRQAINRRIVNRQKVVREVSGNRADPVISESVQTVFDVKQVLNENYHRCLKIIDGSVTVADKIKGITEVRLHVAQGMAILETLYNVNENREFMEEVLQVLDEVDENLRQIILTRLQQKRAIRAAFFSGE